MPSVYANGIQVELHWRNMTTGEQKDSPILSVSGIAAAPVSRDLCAEQGLRNAAGSTPNSPLGLGLFSKVLTQADPTPAYSFQIYAFNEPNQAVVFPITVKQYDPNNPDSSLALRIDASTYTGIENIVSISKDKCDFSQALETVDANGGRRLGYQGLNITNRLASSVPDRSGFNFMGYAYIAPGTYWINIRPALFDGADARGNRLLVRPIQDAIQCGDGQPRHPGSPCNVYVNGLGIAPDFTPFGTSSANPGSSYTCPNGQVVASASLCPATSYTCSDGTIVSTASACPVVRIPLDPATTPTWGTGPDHWVFFSGPMQSSPPPPVCNNLVYANGSCTKPGLCLTQDGQNRYVCQ
jgi:hypothetical protein